jgi:hypothetical protein
MIREIPLLCTLEWNHISFFLEKKNWESQNNISMKIKEKTFRGFGEKKIFFIFFFEFSKMKNFVTIFFYVIMKFFAKNIPWRNNLFVLQFGKCFMSILILNGEFFTSQVFFFLRGIYLFKTRISPIDPRWCLQSSFIKFTNWRLWNFGFNFT